MFTLGLDLKRALEEARTLTITTGAGTSLHMALRLSPGRVSRVVRGARRRLGLVASRWADRAGAERLAARCRPAPPGPLPFVFPPSGLPRAGEATFLGGQLAFRGVSSTVEGVAVIDGTLWPCPDGCAFEAPLTLSIRCGVVVDFTGPPALARALGERFRGGAARVEHFCIGFNPGARPSGNLLEAERTFGAISVGFGEGELHTDGVMTRPTLVTDRGTVETEGRFGGEGLESAHLLPSCI